MPQTFRKVKRLGYKAYRKTKRIAVITEKGRVFKRILKKALPFLDIATQAYLEAFTTNIHEEVYDLKKRFIKTESTIKDRHRIEKFKSEKDLQSGREFILKNQTLLTDGLLTEQLIEQKFGKTFKDNLLKKEKWTISEKKAMIKLIGKEYVLYFVKYLKIKKEITDAITEKSFYVIFDKNTTQRDKDNALSKLGAKIKEQKKEIEMIKKAKQTEKIEIGSKAYRIFSIFGLPEISYMDCHRKGYFHAMFKHKHYDYLINSISKALFPLIAGTYLGVIKPRKNYWQLKQEIFKYMHENNLFDSMRNAAKYYRKKTWLEWAEETKTYRVPQEFRDYLLQEFPFLDTVPLEEIIYRAEIKKGNLDKSDYNYFMQRKLEIKKAESSDDLAKQVLKELPDSSQHKKTFKKIIKRNEAKDKTKKAKVRGQAIMEARHLAKEWYRMVNQPKLRVLAFEVLAEEAPREAKRDALAYLALEPKFLDKKYSFYPPFINKTLRERIHELYPDLPKSKEKIWEQFAPKFKETFLEEPELWLNEVIDYYTKNEGNVPQVFIDIVSEKVKQLFKIPIEDLRDLLYDNKVNQGKIYTNIPDIKDIAKNGRAKYIKRRKEARKLWALRSKHREARDIKINWARTDIREIWKKFTYGSPVAYKKRVMIYLMEYYSESSLNIIKRNLKNYPQLKKDRKLMKLIKEKYSDSELKWKEYYLYY